MVEVTVGDDDGVGVGRPDGVLRGLGGQRAEVEQQGIVDEDGAPADLAGAAEEA